jgi:hypothetical protein
MRPQCLLLRQVQRRRPRHSSLHHRRLGLALKKFSTLLLLGYKSAASTRHLLGCNSAVMIRPPTLTFNAYRLDLRWSSYSAPSSYLEQKTCADTKALHPGTNAAATAIAVYLCTKSSAVHLSHLLSKTSESCLLCPIHSS